MVSIGVLGRHYGNLLYPVYIPGRVFFRGVTDFVTACPCVFLGAVDKQLAGCVLVYLFGKSIIIKLLYNTRCYTLHLIIAVWLI